MPVVSRLPLDASLLDAMLVTCLTWDWLRLAAGLSLAFRGYLRPGELALLRKQHLRFQGRPKPIVVVLALVRPKNRFRAARVQAVTIDDPVAVRLASAAHGRLRHNELLLPGGTAGFTTNFEVLVSTLGCASIGYTPGSLRSGGVVADFAAGTCNLTDIMFKGRWEAPRSVSRYLQAGMAAWAMTHVPEGAADLAHGLAQLLPDLLLDTRLRAVAPLPAHRPAPAAADIAPIQDRGEVHSASGMVEDDPDADQDREFFRGWQLVPA